MIAKIQNVVILSAVFCSILLGSDVVRMSMASADVAAMWCAWTQWSCRKVPDSSTACLMMRSRRCCRVQSADYSGAQATWCNGSGVQAVPGSILNHAARCSVTKNRVGTLTTTSTCRMVSWRNTDWKFSNPEVLANQSSASISPVQQCSCSAGDSGEDVDVETSAGSTLRPPTLAVAWDLLIAVACGSVAIAGVSVWCVARLRRFKIQSERLRAASGTQWMGTLVRFDRITERIGDPLTGSSAAGSFSLWPRPPPYSPLASQQIANCSEPPPPYSEFVSDQA